MLLWLFLLFAKQSSLKICIATQATRNVCPDGSNVVLTSVFPTWITLVEGTTTDIYFYPATDLVSDSGAPLYVDISKVPQQVASFNVICLQTKKVYIDTATDITKTKILSIKNANLFFSQPKINVESLELDTCVMNTEQIVGQFTNIAGDAKQFLQFSEITCTKADFSFKDLSVTKNSSIVLKNAKNVGIRNFEQNTTLYCLQKELMFVPYSSTNGISIVFAQAIPSIGLVHSKAKVCVSIIEVFAIKSRLIHKFSFDVSNDAILAFPKSIAPRVSDGAIQILNFDKNTTLIQKGKYLPFEISIGDNLDYVIGHGAEFVYSILATDREGINFISENENQAQTFTVGGFNLPETTVAKNKNLNLQAAHMHVIAPATVKGEAKFLAKVVNLIGPSVTTDNFGFYGDSTVDVRFENPVTKLTSLSEISFSKDVKMQVSLPPQDYPEPGLYPVFCSPNIKCEKFTTSFYNTNTSNKVSTYCSNSCYGFNVSAYSESYYKSFCVTSDTFKNYCPSNTHVITSEEGLSQWTKKLYTDTNTITFTIVSDFDSTATPVVIDFSNITTKDNTITISKYGGFTTNKEIQITQTSFDNKRIKKLIVDSMQIGVSKSSGMIALPLLELKNKATLTQDFHKLLDIQYQEKYIVDLSSQSSFLNIAPVNLEIQFDDSSATILFVNNGWKCTFSSKNQPFFIDYTQQLLVLSPSYTYSNIVLEYNASDVKGVGKAKVMVTNKNNEITIKGDWPSGKQLLEISQAMATKITIETANPPAIFGFKSDTPDSSFVTSLPNVYIKEPIHLSGEATLEFKSQTESIYNVSSIVVSKNARVSLNTASKVIVSSLKIKEETQFPIPQGVTINHLYLDPLSTADFYDGHALDMPQQITAKYSFNRFPSISLHADIKKLNVSTISLEYSKEANEDELYTQYPDMIYDRPFQFICGAALECAEVPTIEFISSPPSLNGDATLFKTTCAANLEGKKCIMVGITKPNPPPSIPDSKKGFPVTKALIGGCAAIILFVVLYFVLCKKGETPDELTIKQSLV